MFFDMQLEIQEKKKLRLRFRKGTVKHDEALYYLVQIPQKMSIGFSGVKKC